MEKIITITCLDNEGYWEKRTVFINKSVPNWLDMCKRVYLDHNVKRTYTIVR